MDSNLSGLIYSNGLIQRKPQLLHHTRAFVFIFHVHCWLINSWLIHLFWLHIDFLSNKWNLKRLGGHVHGLVTKIVHKTLVGGHKDEWGLGVESRGGRGSGDERHVKFDFSMFLENVKRWLLVFMFTRIGTHNYVSP